MARSDWNLNKKLEKLARIEEIRDEQRRIDAERQAEQDRIAAAASAAEQAELDRLKAIDDDYAAVVAEIGEERAAIERDRLAKVRAEAEAAEAVKTLWARAAVDESRLEADTFGTAPHMRVRAEIALRKATDMIAPAELWRIDGPSLAEITFAGLQFRVNRYVSDIVVGGGFMDIVTVNVNGTGWRPVYGPADLATLPRQYPTLYPPNGTPAGDTPAPAPERSVDEWLDGLVKR